MHIDNGVLTPTPSLPFAERLLHIHRGLRAVIEATGPTSVALERIYTSKNAASALKLGHARGIAMLAACEAGLPIAEFSASEIKLAVSGSGRADKHQVQQMVRVLLGLPEVAAEDASDALAAAICKCQHRELPPANPLSALLAEKASAARKRKNFPIGKST